MGGKGFTHQETLVIVAGKTSAVQLQHTFQSASTFPPDVADYFVRSQIGCSQQSKPVGMTDYVRFGWLTTSDVDGRIRQIWTWPDMEVDAGQDMKRWLKVHH